MSAIGVEAKAKVVRDKIAAFLLEHKDVSSDERWTPEFLNEKLRGITDAFAQLIAGEAAQFIDRVATFQKELAAQTDKDMRLFTPASDVEEMAYYAQKADLVRELEHQKPKDIVEAYEQALESEHLKKAQMLEESAYGILLGKDRHIAGSFSGLVERNKENRLSERVKSDSEKAPAFNSLVRVAERIVEAASAGRLADSALYSFYALSNFDDDGIIDLPAASWNIKRVAKVTREIFQV